MTKTSKEKQADFRARQAILGHKEVRGIYLPEELHAALKEHAARLLGGRDDERVAEKPRKKPLKSTA